MTTILNKFAPTGGKIRALAALLAFVVVILTSPQVANLGLAWLTPVVAGINALLQGLTRFTSIGDKPAAP